MKWKWNWRWKIGIFRPEFSGIADGASYHFLLHSLSFECKTKRHNILTKLHNNFQASFLLFENEKILRAHSPFKIVAIYCSLIVNNVLWHCVFALVKVFLLIRSFSVEILSRVLVFNLIMCLFFERCLSARSSSPLPLYECGEWVFASVWNYVILTSTTGCSMTHELVFVCGALHHLLLLLRFLCVSPVSGP